MESSAIDKCAACGKEGDGLKFCNGCKLVKYCSRDCQATHRPQHKKECKKRAAEIYDEKLFKEVELEECPICMLPLSEKKNTAVFQSCCGKRICNGCICAMDLSGGKLGLCPFCREPNATSVEEHNKRTKKQMEKGNAEAFNMLAGVYAQGLYGTPQNRAKANELWLKAGELGSPEAYYQLGNNYYFGRGVESDMKKAKHYYELAAMIGHVTSRNTLGALEGLTGNDNRAMKHFILAAKAGYESSLEMVKQGFIRGDITKDEYASTLRVYQKIQDQMKSDERDNAFKGAKSSKFVLVLAGFKWKGSLVDIETDRRRVHIE